MRMVLACRALAIAAAIAGASAASAETLRVGKPTPLEFNFAMGEIGSQAGIFARHGIELDIVTLEGSAKLHQAMVAGSIDIAIGAGTDFLFIVKGAPEKGVAAMAGPPSNFFLMVPTGSPIKTIADLKGKRISVSTVGSLSYWFVQELSRRQGWGDNGVVFVQTGGPQATALAIASGSLDAAFQALQGGLQMEQAGKGHFLFSFADFIHPFLAHAIYASNDLIRKNPDAVRHFLAAWFETIAFTKSHRDETIRYAQTITHTDPELGGKIYDVEMPAFSDDGRFDSAAIKIVLESLLDMKQIDRLPAAKEIYTEEFLPK